ncbi:CinA family protein [Babesia caballi]|uniref:CinA family protein n=1 Tax=Babesia caballi TaxID=5871 RepID=A0AAV4LUA5_BABCB|nr:CinA family protein [Babesia caballi]
MGWPGWWSGRKRVRPCTLLKLRTEGVEGRIFASDAVGCVELLKVFERLTDNLVTGHTGVELSATEAILFHELFKFTVGTKALAIPLGLALHVQLSKPLEDELDRGEEILNGNPIGVFNSGKHFGPLGTAVSRCVDTIWGRSCRQTIRADNARLQNTTVRYLPSALTSLIPIYVLVPNNLLQPGSHSCKRAGSV